jgi:biopolymer transport protein ExbD
MRIVRPRRTASSIDMTPLIDCVFQLLIFFMLSSTFLTPKLELALPEANPQGPFDRAEEVVVSIDAQGRLFVNHAPATFDRLADTLEAELAGKDEKVVTIRGDKTMAFDLFVRAMSAAQMAGARRVDVAHLPQ